MNHTADRIDLALGAHHAAVPGIGRAGERRSDRHAWAWPIPRTAERQGQVQVRQLVVRQREPDLRDVNGVDGGDRVADGYELSDVDALAPNPTRVRRRDLRTLEVTLGAPEVGLGRCNCRTCVVQLRFAQRQLAGVTESQLLPLAPSDLSLGFLLGQSESRLRQLRPRADHGLLVIERVDRHQDVPRVEETALRKRGCDARHPAGDLGTSWVSVRGRTVA